MTRRSEWFVTKSPLVEWARADRLHNFVLPATILRSDDRAGPERNSFTPAPSRGWPSSTRSSTSSTTWIRHIQGIRRLPGADGRTTTRSHSPEFFRDVVEMTKQYLATRPDPDVLDFLSHDFMGLEQRYGRVRAPRSAVPVLSRSGTSKC